MLKPALAVLASGSLLGFGGYALFRERHLSGIVERAYWYRAIVREHESCSTHISTDSRGHSHISTSCYWSEVQRWEAKGGPDDSPRWPDAPPAPFWGSIRNRTEATSRVRFVLPSGQADERACAEADVATFRPRTAWSYTYSLAGGISQASPLEPEAP